ncbi:hypothetical protein H671_3g9075 [Cricetulus griseus]|uniref:Uncharacterized protein n=1 Tax=Cricetulus griseus TaxID=10029 RepID=A0A061IDK2_CRIGR|nr:hypothetical protein H671_3g9075 [Cricetulus griseus]
MTSEDYNRQELDNVKKSQMSSRSSAPDLYKLPDISWPWNSGPQFSPVPAHNINKDSEDTESTSSSSDSDSSEDSLSCLEDTTSYYNSAPHDAEEAETEDTGSDTMLSVISLDWLWIHEDNSGTGMPGPQSDTEVTASISTSRDLKETDVQCREETHDTIDILDIQSENPEYENTEEIAVQQSPPISSKDQPQEGAIASKKKHRRGWKGVSLLKSPCVAGIPEEEQGKLLAAAFV